MPSVALCSLEGVLRRLFLTAVVIVHVLWLRNLCFAAVLKSRLIHDVNQYGAARVSQVSLDYLDVGFSTMTIHLVISSSNRGGKTRNSRLDTHLEGYSHVWNKATRSRKVLL